MERKFTILLVVAATLLVISSIAVTVLLVHGDPVFLNPFRQYDRCSTSQMISQAEAMGVLVHHFEDVKFVAILTNREQLVGPILKLQDIRYEAEGLDLPECLVALEKTSIDYMNSVIVYLSHHMAGLDAEQVRTEFLYSEELLQAYQAEYALITGKTFEVPVPEVTPGG